MPDIHLIESMQTLHLIFMCVNWETRSARPLRLPTSPSVSYPETASAPLPGER